jgi:hypothetical protein
VGKSVTIIGWVEPGGMAPVYAKSGLNAIWLICHTDRKPFVTQLPERPRQGRRIFLAPRRPSHIVNATKSLNVQAAGGVLMCAWLGEPVAYAKAARIAVSSFGIVANTAWLVGSS